MNVNEAEFKIQYIKYRPSLPYNSKSPVTFTIPGNTTPHVSLRDSYLFVQCHVEETDEYGNPPTTDPTRAKISLNYEGEEEATPPSKTIKKDTSVDEEDTHLSRRENGSSSHRGITEEQSGTRQVMASDVEDYLEEAEHRWKKAQRAWTAFHTEMDMSEKAKKHINVEGLEDPVCMRTTTVSRSKVPSPSRLGGGWGHNSHRQCPALHVEWSRYYHEWRTRQYHQSKVHVQILHRNHLKQQSLYQGISTEIEQVLW